jgi:hypothetical protein
MLVASYAPCIFDAVLLAVRVLLLLLLLLLLLRFLPLLLLLLFLPLLLLLLLQLLLRILLLVLVLVLPLLPADGTGNIGNSAPPGAVGVTGGGEDIEEGGAPPSLGPCARLPGAPPSDAPPIRWLAAR